MNISFLKKAFELLKASIINHKPIWNLKHIFSENERSLGNVAIFSYYIPQLE
jgi:hypothetical protein